MCGLGAPLFRGSRIQGLAEQNWRGRLLAGIRRSQTRRPFRHGSRDETTRKDHTMEGREVARSSEDLVGEIKGLSVGAGIIAMTLFPFALPGLVMALPLALLAVPLLVLAGVGYLVMRVVGLAVGLVGRMLRRGDASGDDLAAREPQAVRRMRHDTGHTALKGG